MPRTLQTCEMDLIWLVRGDAKEGVDYDKDKLKGQADLAVAGDE